MWQRAQPQPESSDSDSDSSSSSGDEDEKEEDPDEFGNMLRFFAADDIEMAKVSPPPKSMQKVEYSNCNCNTIVTIIVNASLGMVYRPNVMQHGNIGWRKSK